MSTNLVNNNHNATKEILKGARVYLSGPMDFVACRTEEKTSGWRTRLSQFLRHLRAIVFDPWTKPHIIGQDGYGNHYEYADSKRLEWTFDDTDHGRLTRAQLCDLFYPTVHINRRMVDICDFLIAFCPTNVYSVGTVNEIVRARLQHKPVLLVSPPILFPAYEELKQHLIDVDDQKGLELLCQLKNQVPLKTNAKGTPSPWYLALMYEDYFFDGFGFKQYFDHFNKTYNWQYGQLDENEERTPPSRPLLPYLERLNREIPRRYDPQSKMYVENTDWLILEPALHR